MHTDYALRALLHAAANPGVRLSITGVSGRHGISRNHMMKVINQLAIIGLIDTARGRGGGFTLAKEPADITLGAVVRHTEPSLQPADCAKCVLNRGCGLKPILGEAMEAFLAVLDRRTLADALAESDVDIAALRSA